MSMKESYKVLLGCTGSVASCKTIELIKLFQGIKLGNYTVEVRVVATENALNFIHIPTLKKYCNLYSDDKSIAISPEDEKDLSSILNTWADIFIIAPIDANTLAKLANGLYDNLITEIARGWDFSKPIIFTPAMNIHMWSHPITSVHVSKLNSMGYIEIPCISKQLFCGDVGFGAMAETSTICNKLTEILTSLSHDSNTN